MSYVYYGNYSLYYEQGRTEAIKSLGVSYKWLEEQGIMMPVADMKVRYKGPAKYDELLKVVTVVSPNFITSPAIESQSPPFGKIMSSCE